MPIIFLSESIHKGNEPVLYSLGLRGSEHN